MSDVFISDAVIAAARGAWNESPDSTLFVNTIRAAVDQMLAEGEVTADGEMQVKFVCPTCNLEWHDTADLRQVQPDGHYACSICDDGELLIFPAGTWQEAFAAGEITLGPPSDPEGES